MNEIQLYRKSVNMSQSQFAKEFDIPLKTLQRWEQNRNPTPKYVLNFLKRLITIPIQDKAINQIHPLKRNIIINCISIAKNNDEIKQLIVFGSAVTENCDELSDVDICIKMKKDYNKINLHYTVVELSKACEKNCDILLYDELTDYFKDKIKKTGVIVYG